MKIPLKGLSKKKDENEEPCSKIAETFLCLTTIAEPERWHVFVMAQGHEKSGFPPSQEWQTRTKIGETPILSNLLKK